MPWSSIDDEHHHQICPPSCGIHFIYLSLAQRSTKLFAKQDPDRANQKPYQSPMLMRLPLSLWVYPPRTSSLNLRQIETSLIFMSGFEVLVSSIAPPGVSKTEVLSTLRSTANVLEVPDDI